MVNNLASNPVFLDTVDDTSYKEGPIIITGIQWSGDTANARTVTLYNAKNVVSNRGFEEWFATNAAPFQWVLAGASATVAREATTIKTGTYSAALTRSGADCKIEQNIIALAPPPYNSIDWWKGKPVYCGAWCNGSVASRVYTELYDGQTTTESAAHSGTPGWEWIAPAVATVHASATELTLRMKVKTGDTTGYFDGAILFHAEQIWEIVGGATPLATPYMIPFFAKGLFLGGAAGSGNLMVAI
jgi:hypothetical protein